MFIPKTWLNEGETGATPITTRDFSRIENALAGAIGKEINTQYLMKRNTKNISSCMVGDGWIGGSYAGSGDGVVSASTAHTLTGAHGVNCSVEANLGGMYMTKTMDLTKFDCGLPSSEEDWIRFSIYLDEDSLGKLDSLAIMFRTALDVSTNYMWMYFDHTLFIEGWTHINARKGNFIQVGTFDWANVTGVSFFTYPNGADNIVFVLECLEMVRDGLHDDLYTYSFGNMQQPMGTQLTNVKYGLDATDLLSAVYNKSGEMYKASSKIWCNYSGADSCLKVFSTGTKTTGEFQVCEDFYMEDGCVYEIVFKTIGALTSRYRINQIDFWQTDKPRFIEFYYYNGFLTCHTSINGFHEFYTYHDNASFSLATGQTCTMKIYRDGNNYTCVLWKNSDPELVITVGGSLDTKDKEAWVSNAYYSYPYDTVYKPFLELRAYSAYQSDIVYSIKQYKV